MSVASRDCTGLMQVRGVRDPRQGKLQTDLEAVRDLPVEGQEVKSAG